MYKICVSGRAALCDIISQRGPSFTLMKFRLKPSLTSYPPDRKQSLRRQRPL